MKRFIYLFIILIGVGLSAQERVKPLHYNAAYPPQNQPQLKTASFEHPCLEADEIVLSLVSKNLPNCLGSNGSLTVELASNLGELTLSIDDVPITIDGEGVYEIENLIAGVYYITATGTKDGELFETEIFVSLSNRQIGNLRSSDFTTEPAFCSTPGKIKKKGGIASALISYEIFDGDDQLIGFINLGVSALDVPAGDYYVRLTNPLTMCESYLDIEVLEIPTASIPFIDDFSTTLVKPDPANWVDDFAYINNTFPLNPVSIGVATLDGLDNAGYPYEQSDNFVDASADVLTSLPFCFGDLVPADSLILSFYYQVQGIGIYEFPNEDDSLILELLDNTGQWNLAWSYNNLEGNEVQKDTFRLVYEVIDESKYLYDGFQFRIRNTATISGFNDPYHIDYVILDISRNTASVNSIPDFTHLYPAASFTNEYQSMPWSHFFDYQDVAYNNELVYTIKNNKSFADLVVLGVEVEEICNDLPIEAHAVPNLSPEAFSVAEQITNRLEPIPDGLNGNDDIIIRTKYIIEGGDINPDNDILCHDQVFSNYFAYDDGTAEAVYELFGVGAQLAFKYQLNHADTLRAVQIAFNRVVDEIAEEEGFFNITIWSEIEEPGDNSGENVIIYEKEYNYPIYTGSVNGFTTFKLDPPVAVSDSVYIGFELLSGDIIDIGLDFNHANNDKFYINTNNNWFNSIFPGTPMVRPVVGSKSRFDAMPGVIEEPYFVVSNDDIDALSDAEISIYPNPTSNSLYVRFSETPLHFTSQVYDLRGKLLLENQNQTEIQVGDLTAGMYMLRIVDENNQVLRDEKFVKQ